MLYIPVCPTTEASARYVALQRAAFIKGTPAPDFPGGNGESEHIGRPTEEYVKRILSSSGRQILGLERLEAVEGDSPGGKEAIKRANAVLGF